MLLTYVIVDYFYARTMTYIEVISSSIIDEDMADMLYDIIHTLELSDELNLLKYPVYTDKLIKALTQPECIMVVRTRDYNVKYIDRIMLIKESRMKNFRTDFPVEYSIVSRLLESVENA